MIACHVDPVIGLGACISDDVVCTIFSVGNQSSIDDVIEWLVCGANHQWLYWLHWQLLWPSNMQQWCNYSVEELQDFTWLHSTYQWPSQIEKVIASHRLISPCRCSQLNGSPMLKLAQQSCDLVRHLVSPSFTKSLRPQNCHMHDKNPLYQTKKWCGKSFIIIVNCDSYHLSIWHLMAHGDVTFQPAYLNGW